MTRTRTLTLLLCVAMVANTGCLFRSRKVESHFVNSPLKSATQQELIDKVNAAAASITSMNATVDIDTSVGGEKKGEITEYSEIRGYILIQKPAMLRMIGLMPVVRNRAFDMVSDGQTFKLSIPPKNRFLTGPNEVVTPSKNPLENLRPPVLYDALLPRTIDPANEIAVLESGTQEVVDPRDSKKRLRQANYRLDIVKRDARGEWFLSRKIYFNRVDLLPYRQVVFDRTGNIATDVRYAGFQQYDGMAYPATIEIQRPQEEYTIGLKIVTLKLNTPLKPEQFDLPQPPGAEVKVLGSK
jgi:outer membrane lipoprotein-sorting protein